MKEVLMTIWNMPASELGDNVASAVWVFVGIVFLGVVVMGIIAWWTKD